MTQEPTVFVVDDDEATRRSVRWLVESVGLRVEDYATPRAFLAHCGRDRPGCLVLDVRMPDMSGLDLQSELQARERHIPVIFVTAHANVSIAVRAMKAGAVDVLEKPYNDQDLLEHIRRALVRDAEAWQARSARAAFVQCLASLTPRERQILERVVAGRSSKKIAYELAISEKTVEVHRAHIMQKLHADTVAKLVRDVMLYGYEPDVAPPRNDPEA